MAHMVVERAAGHIAESAHQASRAASAVADAIEDGVEEAKRAAKQGGDAAEELLSDATQRVQRHPGLAIAATFATGLMLGALVAWTMKRR